MSKMTQKLDEDQIIEAIEKFVKNQAFMLIESREITDVEIVFDKRTSEITAIVETDIKSSLDPVFEEPIVFDKNLYEKLAERERGGMADQKLAISFDDEDSEDTAETEEE